MGSRNVKVALMDEEGVINYYIFDTIIFYREHGKLTQGKLQVHLDKLLKVSHINNVVATGYGRQTINLANALIIPEIKAHVTGAIYSTGLQDFTLLDLGGQDSKVALVRGGRMVDFQTNDKCAASTGRYLENMAGVLDMTLSELSKHHADPVDLTSTCAIFGETELIGRIVEGYDPKNLAAGVNHSIFKRIRPMLQQLLSPVIVFTGGVAASPALTEIIGNELGVKVLVPSMHQYAGAIGCSVIARANFLKNGE
ncbi:acyl-CoA dehydratase activase [Desulfotruncus alcoholivorax]|uniref:acyl-CoA dehydratase activase n=1 Tax=Desulfotruncus alcoholivorax TaxID=265477 RepID=UPI0038993732